MGAWGEASQSTGINGDGGNDNAENSGAVYVFRRRGLVWEQEAYIKASNVDAADEFGSALAIDRDTLVVGAPGEDSSDNQVNGNEGNDGTPQAGAAYVFRRMDGVWRQEAYLKPHVTGTQNFFGAAVAVRGDTVVVGARGEKSNATGVDGDAENVMADNSGAAYVFERRGGSWQQTAYLKASNTGEGDQFGYLVDIDGDTIAVGAAREDGLDDGTQDDSGAVYVFRRLVDGWGEDGYLKASNPGINDRFGFGLAVDGPRIFVGAHLEDSDGRGVFAEAVDNNAAEDSGAVYIFERNAGVWSQSTYIKAANADGAPPMDGTVRGDAFGQSLQAKGPFLLVGANLEDSGASGVDSDADSNTSRDSGAAYLFREQGGTWTQVSYLKPSNGQELDNFGFGATLFADSVVLGAPGEDSAAQGTNGNENSEDAPASGAVYVFH